MSAASDVAGGGKVRAGVRRVLWAAWMPLAARAARVGVAGPALEDALRVSRGFKARGFSATVCFWNLPGSAPDGVVESYLSAIAALRSSLPGAYLSIKAPELEFSAERTARVGRAGAKAGIGIHFDSHGPEDADATFECVAAAQAAGAAVGCTLPGRWSRSLSDAEWLAPLAMRVRVVKGQWKDPDRPETDPAAGFIGVVRRLAGRAAPVSVASHDPATARVSLAALQSSGTPCDIELLFGLPLRPALQVAREMGVPVRMYVPYGHGWLAYCLTQVSRNPRILWWIARDMLSRSGLPA